MATCKGETVAEISKEDRSMFGKGEEDTEISKEDRERARSILQCKEDREKERATSILHKLTNHSKKAREGATSILQKLTDLCKEDRGGCIDSAKTYAVESWWQGIMGQVSTFRSFSGCIE